MASGRGVFQNRGRAVAQLYKQRYKSQQRSYSDDDISVE
jgi:hypothetical protein